LRCPPGEELTSGFDYSLGGLVTLRHGETVAHEPGGALPVALIGGVCDDPAFLTNTPCW